MNGINFDNDDKLAKLDATFAPEPTARKDIWRWLYLYKHCGIELDPDTCNGGSMRDAIADALETRPSLIHDLRSNADKLMLPTARLAWIKEDERQIRWLLDQVDVLTGEVLPSGFPHLIGRDEIISMIDLWKEDLRKKVTAVDKLHALWEKQSIKDIPFEWFADKKEGKDRCICARDWLMNSHLGRLAKKHPIRNHTDLIMLFQEAGTSQFERQELIKQIKGRWARLQFNARNSSKKQINVLLSTKVITSLDKLADQHGLKRAQVIEALIKRETESGSYLDQD